MIIAPSLLAANFMQLETELERLKSIEHLWLHLDVMDGHFVPNLTFGHDIISGISKISSIPLDAHFMVTNPEFYIDTLSHIALTNFTFHLEASQDVIELIKKAKNVFPSVGISIKPNTPASDLTDEILRAVDLVLIMSVEPGFGGQKFMPSALDKIASLKARRESLNTSFSIQVDGGLNEQNAPLVWNAGADNIVAGSSVFRHPSGNYQTAIDALRP